MRIYLVDHGGNAVPGDADPFAAIRVVFIERCVIEGPERIVADDQIRPLFNGKIHAGCFDDGAVDIIGAVDRDRLKEKRKRDGGLHGFCNCGGIVLVMTENRPPCCVQVHGDDVQFLPRLAEQFVEIVAECVLRKVPAGGVFNTVCFKEAVGQVVPRQGWVIDGQFSALKTVGREFFETGGIGIGRERIQLLSKLLAKNIVGTDKTQDFL